MGLTQQAAQDFADFISDEDLFAIPIKFKSPDSQIAIVAGSHVKHHMKLDFNSGMVANALHVAIVISELKMAANFPDYPIRNNNAASEHFQKVNMLGHIIELVDITGIVKTYKVIENIADETLGSLVLILSPYAE